MRKALFASDLIVFGYMAVVTALVLLSWNRIPDPGLYLAAHALVAAMILMIIHAHERRGGKFWRFLRYWFLIFVIPASFREVYLLAPCVHPYDSLVYDH